MQIAATLVLGSFIVFYTIWKEKNGPWGEGKNTKNKAA